MEQGAFDIAPLPGWARVDDAIAEALPNLKPHGRVRVTEAAARRKIESGGQWVPWRPDVAPYMNEIGDLVTSRRFDSIGVVGPARCSKSEGALINPLVHAILERPRVVAVFSPTRDAANEWSIGALDPLIENSPDLRERLLTGKGADNVFTKKFRGGCRVTIDWPVKSKLAQRSIDLVIGTDYDAFPEDVGGDADPFTLMRKRTESAQSRGMTVVESSPRKPVLDENWTAKAPHEAPPAEGIAAIFNAGSRGRLYWTCPHCGQMFIPEWETLDYPEDGSPEERGAGAHMVCPHNGCVIEPRAKVDLNRGAQWLHWNGGTELVPIGDLTRLVSTASFWIPGPAAALAPWSRIVSRVLAAEDAYRMTGGEKALQAAHNIELGRSYLPRARVASQGLTPDVLRKLASLHAWQVCPAGTRFVTIAVDTQVGWFAVQVEAWLSDMERVVIDRFDITAPPDGAERRLELGKRGEDWVVLETLASRAYPVEGADYALTPIGIAVDAAGEAGVTPNARAFWRRMKRKHRGPLYHLVRGRPGDNVKRAAFGYPDTAHKGKDHVARDVPWIWVGTDRLKDEVSASLLREGAGARKLHVSTHAPEAVFDEMASERREVKGWRPRPGVKRNESFDCSVYALAMVIALEAEAINWDRPPKWAVCSPDNMRAVPIEAPDAREAPGDPAPVAKKRGRRGWSVRGGKSSW
ncbi:terminase gpA endonuclease subunit [Tropicimonas sp. IMCC34043]|uniref:terminase gpA endonuclease subunit n=1 Tax=Tropicimonas sp. IMCC34043 TaxID=2248760 RepID=UPI000E2297C9|nr:terminase gpA endonuclease subunit [Tropicimonas sp. IMCC34043]